MAKKRSKQDLIAAEKKRLVKARMNKKHSNKKKKVKIKSKQTDSNIDFFSSVMGYSQNLVKQDIKKTLLVSTIVFLALLIIINLQ